jgi:hypothetical protein
MENNTKMKAKIVIKAGIVRFDLIFPTGRGKKDGGGGEGKRRGVERTKKKKRKNDAEWGKSGVEGEPGGYNMDIEVKFWNINSM